jgi:diaminohydroxyphosphoribosylaminopyrimidine deaminase/5-amino-6-(5-phosphoribosylamino)uracil reductase
MQFTEFDKKIMYEVLSIAKKGCGTTGPNPRVGAILVKNKKVISKAYHTKAGLPHAETIAINRAKENLNGAFLYVNLEPCSHFGLTPPCIDSIINAGIKKVFYSIDDPDPRNMGRGANLLRKAGITVCKGLLKEEAESLNAGFIKRNVHGLPLVTLKLATSIDGKIATSIGQSKWISSEKSRAIVQCLRMQTDAILVGVNTVLRDDPLLSVKGRHAQPLKVILDSDLRIPLDSRILSCDKPNVIIVCNSKCSKTGVKKLIAKNVVVWNMASCNGLINLKQVLKRLALEIKINYVLCEGGAKVSSSLLKQGCVDRIVFFIAPVLIGGAYSICDIGVKRLQDAIRLKNIKYKFLGPDLMVEANVYRDC